MSDERNSKRIIPAPGWSQRDINSLNYFEPSENQWSSTLLFELSVAKKGSQLRYFRAYGLRALQGHHTSLLCNINERLDFRGSPF